MRIATLWICFIVMIAAGAHAGADDTTWVAGQHYTVLPAAEPTSVKAGEVAIVEVMAYTCPHCYALQEPLKEWQNKQAPYVRFEQLPAAWGRTGESLARLHYTLEELHRADLQPAIFDAVRQAPKSFASRDDAEVYAAHLEFARSNGIDAAAFARAYQSATVSSKVKRSHDLVEKYRITATPTMVINGKYTVDAVQALGDANVRGPARYAPMLAVATDLAAKEHSAQPTTRAARR